MPPEISIAIVLYNSAETLTDCLRSLHNAVDAGFAEVIAVDNASPDGGVKILRRELPAARLTTLPENRGFAAGANAALAQANGRYWMLVNPDVSVPALGLETLVRWMDSHPKVGAASPNIVGNDGTWESPGRAFPSIARSLLELSRLHRALPRRLRGRLLRGPYWTGGDQVDTGWVPGTAMIVRPAAATAVGLLDEGFFMYGEDLEWCWRMRRAGWRIGVCAETTFGHDKSSSARRSFGDIEKERRIAAGVDAACRAIYGAAHARMLAGVSAVALMLEAQGPGRSSGHRQRMRHAARIWRDLALARR